MNLEVIKKITWAHVGVIIVAVLMWFGLDRSTAQDVAPHIESVLESAQEEIQTESEGREVFGVATVYDGDTLTLANGEKLRLIGIDAPEIHEEESYAIESRDFLRALLLDQKVSYEQDKTERDKYGRLLVYLYVEDVLINERMVEVGLAHARAFPPDTKRQEILEKAEERAKLGGLGIWSDE